ncbi:hypothetical protein BJ742DRAFT_771575 [Cladochytrium replicatum]|nr:hypothetical protein BJ742DRAFT_771575 [Cladochytrium replicatum]
MPCQSSSLSALHLDLIVRVFEESRRILEEERLAREEEARSRAEVHKTNELQLELMRTIPSLGNNSKRDAGLIMLQRFIEEDTFSSTGSMRRIIFTTKTKPPSPTPIQFSPNSLRSAQPPPSTLAVAQPSAQRAAK